MKARFAAAATADPAAPKTYIKIPDDEMVKSPPMATCTGCHNKDSPSFKPFCFFEARQKIAHLNPAKPRTEEEKKAMLVCGCGDKCTCTDGCPEGKCGVPPAK